MQIYRKASELTDSDQLVWLWSALESSWKLYQEYVAMTLFKTWPERFTHWLPEEAIGAPEEANCQQPNTQVQP